MVHSRCSTNIDWIDGSKNYEHREISNVKEISMNQKNKSHFPSPVYRQRLVSSKFQLVKYILKCLFLINGSIGHKIVLVYVLSKVQVIFELLVQ